MKLLLTSGGIMNQSMVKALADLLGKPFSEANLAFIPTAANVEVGDKSWLINDLNDMKNLGFKEVDIVDIAALHEEKMWRPRLENADVLVFGGGNSFYLMHWMEKSGLEKFFPELLKTRVYVGISAGSIVTNPGLLTSQSDRNFYGDEAKGYTNTRGLGFVNFHIRPHLNSPYFPNVTQELLEKLAREIQEPLYAIDDQTALKVVDGKLEIITEGEYIVFNR
ncbi:MAG: Type 1 glutamine amidotransferase-like domain-containing protein [Patescibacteria group bacterium]